MNCSTIYGVLKIFRCIHRIISKCRIKSFLTRDATFVYLFVYNLTIVLVSEWNEKWDLSFEKKVVFILVQRTIFHISGYRYSMVHYTYILLSLNQTHNNKHSILFSNFQINLMFLLKNTWNTEFFDFSR